MAATFGQFPAIFRFSGALAGRMRRDRLTYRHTDIVKSRLNWPRIWGVEFQPRLSQIFTVSQPDRKKISTNFCFIKWLRHISPEQKEPYSYTQTNKEISIRQ